MPPQIQALHTVCFPGEHTPGEVETLEQFFEHATFLHDADDCVWLLLWEHAGTPVRCGQDAVLGSLSRLRGAFFSIFRSMHTPESCAGFFEGFSGYAVRHS